ncbi:MAG: NAD-dependent epimerase/dehydratase family protein [Chitinophagales bacterium]
MKIAVTGANGFIGSALVAFLKESGHDVFCWQRSGNNTVHYDLKNRTLPEVSGLNVVIHTAYIPFSTKHPNAAALNIEGTLRLKAACDAAGVFFVYLSSMSAHQNALSAYGKHKWQLQRQLSGACVIRPGLVVGKGGLFGKMMANVKKWPVQPVIAGGRQPLQIVALTDLVKAIEQFALAKRDGVFTIATSRVYTMRGVLAAIAQHFHKKIHFLNLPYRLIAAMLHIILFMRIPLPVSNENLLGLKQLQPENNEADLQLLGWKLKELEEALFELRD